MTDVSSWSLTDHVCRYCLGRVLRDGDSLRCSCCGVTAKVTKLRNMAETVAVCCCGLNEAIGQKGSKAVRQYFRCEPNKARRAPGDPEIVCTFGGQVVGKVAAL